MDKVSKIGIGVCVILLVGWFFHQQQEAKKRSAETPSPAGAVVVPSPGPEKVPPSAPTPKALETAAPAVPGAVSEPADAAPAPEKFDPGEKEIGIETSRLRAGFSSRGGVVLKENPAAGIRPLREGESGDVALFREDSPLRSLGWISNLTCPEMKAEQEGLRLSFSGTTSDGNFEIAKTYIFREDGYLADLEIRIRNIGPDSIELRDGMHLVCGSIRPIDPEDILGVDVLTPGGIQRQDKPTETTAAGVEWLGLKTKYFCGIVKPLSGPGSSYRVSGVAAVPAVSKAALGCGGSGGSRWEYLSAEARFSDLNLKPGEETSYKFLLFLGPADYDLLASEGHGFQEIIDLGMLSPLVKVIIWLLNRIYGLIGSYGWAIIILTILSKVVLWPLTHKSFKSMKEMQRLQPKIAALKEKCKGDAKKLQAETMKLYKEHGVNPMGGCLPMLLQMPILFALFTALRNTILLRHAPFWIIPGTWIRDLSGPDRLATLPSSYPIIGDQVNILPLLMGASFYLQQKFTPQQPAANEQAAQQQKMMATLMPALFVLMFYSLPSGLNLYFTLSTVVTILQQGALAKKTA